MSILVNTIKEFLKNNRQSSFASKASFVEFDQIQQMEGGGIICFAGSSEGNALASLTREFIQPFASKAANICLLNVHDPDWLNQLGRALKEPVWFAYSIFGVGQDLNFEINGLQRNIWEFCKIPFVRLYGDIPAYFPDRHVGRYKNSINIYGDRIHVEFYRRWFDGKALNAVMPSLVIERKALNEVDVDAKSKGAIIFPKNGNSSASLIDYWETALSETLANCLKSIGEDCISKDVINKELHLDDRIVNYFHEKGIDVSANKTLVCFLVAQVDDFVRRVKSSMIVEAILDLPVIVKGASWGHINFHGRRARLDSSSNYMNTQFLIDSAPAIIDMSPNTVQNPHDRIFRAVGRGTAFLTNQQEYLSSIVEKSNECAFEFDKDSIHDLVEYYVLNPSSAVSLGIRQSQAFRRIHSTEKYVDALKSIIDLKSFHLGNRPEGTQNFVDFPSKEFE